MINQNVELVSSTKGAGKLAGINSEEIISYCARVSNPKNQMNFQSASGLLKYCADNAHWSVFEMSHMTVEITTSRAISAQILRHRSFSFQEHSQRYAKSTNIVAYQARRQDKENRQNSLDDMSEEDKEWFINAQQTVSDLSLDLYEEALKKNVAKECARFLLPLNTATTLYMCGNIRSWIHYIQIRSDKSTQLEHREIALKCKDIFVKEFPMIASALGWKLQSEEQQEKVNE